MVRKILALVLALALTAVFATGCKKKSDSEKAIDNAASQAQKEVKKADAQGKADDAKKEAKKLLK